MARTKTTAVLVKLSKTEKRLLDKAARDAHLPTTTWVRWLCLREAAKAGIVVAVMLFASAARADDKPCDPVQGSTGQLVVPAHCDGNLFHFHSPGWAATSFHVAAMSMVVADISLSLDIKNHSDVVINGVHNSYRESNPLLGHRPSDATFVLYGASVIALHTALWYFAPEEIRPILDLAVIVVEVPYVGGNLSYGLRFRIPFAG